MEERLQFTRSDEARDERAGVGAVRAAPVNGALSHSCCNLSTVTTLACVCAFEVVSTGLESKSIRHTLRPRRFEIDSFGVVGCI